VCFWQREAMDRKSKIDSENMLCQLAQSLTAGGDHLTAIALRKLVLAGYTTVEYMDAAPDWILLSIAGVSVKRLSAVRALTRANWRPPSAQAIQVMTWSLTAARFALRFWPPETLATVIRGSAPRLAAGCPVEERLATDVFSQAACKALGYCHVEELLWALQPGSVALLESIWRAFVAPQKAQGPSLKMACCPPQPRDRAIPHWYPPSLRCQENCPAAIPLICIVIFGVYTGTEIGNG
jgi:hypothetical protein